MGWYYTKNANKEDIIKQILDPIRENDNLVDHRVVYEDDCHVLWTVEKGEKDGHPYQFIGCYLIQSIINRLHGLIDWGYKPMDETMGPYYYSVPQEWLDKYPFIAIPEHESLKKYSEEWRIRVRKPVEV